MSSGRRRTACGRGSNPRAWLLCARGAAGGHPLAGEPSRVVLTEIDISWNVRQLHAALAHLLTGPAQRLPDEIAPFFQGQHPVACLAASTFVRVLLLGAG